MRWYGTDLPFISGTTLINSRDLNDDQISPLVVGEVPRWEHDATFNGLWVKPAGLTGIHLCESQWFATGEPWPVTLPPTVYDAQNIPECCGRLNDPTDGGVQFGGEAGDQFTGTDPADGGVQFGGEAGEQFTGTDPADGGVQFGGEAGEQFTGTDGAQGGAQLGGEAGDVLSYPDPTDGGVEFGGEAGDDYSAGGGVWERDIGDDYIFTAEYTGDHRIKMIGGGGGGGSGMEMSALAGGGGGGGAYSEIVIAMVLGNAYNVHVGNGGAGEGGAGEDTSIERLGITYCLAVAGTSGVLTARGEGGLAVDCIGTVRHNGGDGEFGQDPTGGGGGSSGGDLVDGISAVGQPGAIAPSGGGDGGNGGDNLTVGQPGVGRGGGAGGSGKFEPTTAPGHDGWIRIEWPA